VYPWDSRSPANFSESTWFFGHPSVSIQYRTHISSSHDDTERCALGGDGGEGGI
jgi:hypothetical protein